MSNDHHAIDRPGADFVSRVFDKASGNPDAWPGDTAIGHDKPQPEFHPPGVTFYPGDGNIGAKPYAYDPRHPFRHPTTPAERPPWDGLKEQELLTLRIEIKEARLRLATIEAMARELPLLAGQADADENKAKRSSFALEAAKLRLVVECFQKT